MGYCIKMWYHGNKIMIDKLQKLMNKFVRMMFGLNKSDDASAIMKSHNLLHMEVLLQKIR